MKIAFLDSIEATTYGGMEEWIRLVAEGLANRGHEAYVIGRAGSNFLERLPCGHPGLFIVPLKISGDFDPTTIARIKKLLHDNEIDILSVNFNKDVRLGGLAARLHGRTRVVWSLGLDITSDRFIHKWLTPRLIEGVVVPSQALKDEVVASGYIQPDDVAVIPIGIPELSGRTDRARAREQLLTDYDLPPDSVITATVGRFVEHKGHRYLIDAAVSIAESHPNVRFLLLGDGPNEDILRERISALNLRKYFIFAGMVANVDQILAGADVMIHPSIQEPFGIAILEGMRAGLPVVASNVGGIPEVVDEGTTALLVEPGDASALGASVLRILRNTERMRQMGKAGHQRWHDGFRYDQMIDRLETYFGSMVNTHEV